jgi:hypothetical protein
MIASFHSNLEMTPMPECHPPSGTAIAQALADVVIK